jgi:hypothetical protein
MRRLASDTSKRDTSIVALSSARGVQASARIPGPGLQEHPAQRGVLAHDADTRISLEELVIGSLGHPRADRATVTRVMRVARADPARLAVIVSLSPEPQEDGWARDFT